MKEKIIEQANGNISELIEILVIYKTRMNNGICCYPTYQYPKTEEEIKCHEQYCEKICCNECKKIYKEEMIKSYKDKYLIK